MGSCAPISYSTSSLQSGSLLDPDACVYRNRHTGRTHLNAPSHLQARFCLTCLVLTLHTQRFGFLLWYCEIIFNKSQKTWNLPRNKILSIWLTSCILWTCSLRIVVVCLPNLNSTPTEKHLYIDLAPAPTLLPSSMSLTVITCPSGTNFFHFASFVISFSGHMLHCKTFVCHCVCACAHDGEWSVGTRRWIWRSEGSFGEVVLSFHLYVSSRTQT